MKPTFFGQDPMIRIGFVNGVDYRLLSFYIHFAKEIIIVFSRCLNVLNLIPVADNNITGLSGSTNGYINERMHSTLPH